MIAQTPQAKPSIQFSNIESLLDLMLIVHDE